MYIEKQLLEIFMYTVSSNPYKDPIKTCKLY